MNYFEYIKVELLVLIPVLYLIGVALKISRLKDKWIPLVLGGVSVFLCLLWVLSTSKISTFAESCTAVFTAVTQGVLLSGASVYANQIFKQSKK